MKRLFPLMLAGLCAAASLLSCQKEISSEAPVSDEMTIQFAADPVETRATFTAPEGTSYPVIWTANDKEAKVSLNFAKEVTAKIEPAADGKTARFVAKISAPSPAPADYTFYLISPASAVTANFNASYSSATVTVPAVQTPLAASPDEAAMILVGASAKLPALTETVPVSFKHFTAYGKLALKNLSLGSATVLSVELTADAPMAGKWYYYPEAPETSKAATETDGGKITLLTSATEDIWFASAPVDLSGKKLTVTVKTDAGAYTRTVTLPADRKLESGKIALLSVDMASAQFRAAQVFERIRSTDELVTNAKVVIAAIDPKLNFAVSSADKGNNRAEAAINRVGDKIFVSDDDVEVFRIGTGSATASYTLQATSPTAPGYMVGVSDQNYFKTSATATEFADWTVTLKDNYAFIQNVKSERLIRYNKKNNIFSTYAANSTAVRDSVAIYRLVGVTPKADPELKLGKTSLELTVGATVEIDVERKSTGAVSMRSEDETIATVDEDGMILGVAPGMCRIFVTVAETDTYDSATAICTVKVKSTEAKTLPYAETFNNTLGDFVVEHKTLPEGLTYVWNPNSGYAKASGHTSSKEYEAEDWLVSPAVDLTTATQAALSFEYVTNFGDATNYASQFYLQINNGTEWTRVDIAGLPTKGSYTWYYGVVDLAAYLGKTIKVALVYNSIGQSASAPTIEVRNLKFDTAAESRISVKDKISLTLGGDPVSLGATVNSGATLEYVSSNTAAVTVSDAGMLTPVAAGTSTITIKAPAKGVYSAATATCEVTVVDPSAIGAVYALYSGDLTEGDYVIVYDGAAMNTTVSSNRLQFASPSIADGKIGDPDESIVWHIAKDGDFWTIYNAKAEKYAASTGSRNQATVSATLDDKARWTVTGTSTYDFENKQNKANSVNAILRKNGTYGFACYAASTGGALSLYKKQ